MPHLSDLVPFQDKLEISIYLSWDQYKEILCISVCHIGLHVINFKLACCLENSVDPDQLASEEAS